MAKTPKKRHDNPQLIRLISYLKKASRDNDARIWASIAGSLDKARSRRVSVNLSRISRHAQKGQIVAVPGKVLGAGKLNAPMTIAAFAFSAKAIEKVKKSKGKCLTLPELVTRNPKGSNVRIVG